MRSLKKPEEQGEDENNGHGNSMPFGYMAACAGWTVVILFVRAVLIERVEVFFGGFVIWEHGGTLGHFMIIQTPHFHLLSPKYKQI